MTVVDEDFTVYYGQDLIITHTTRDPVTGAVVDITGWTLEARYRGVLSNTLILTIAGVLTDAPNGVSTYTHTDTQIETLTERRYSFSVWRTDDGSENPLTVGIASVVRT